MLLNFFNAVYLSYYSFNYLKEYKTAFKHERVSLKALSAFRKRYRKLRSNSNFVVKRFLALVKWKAWDILVL